MSLDDYKSIYPFAYCAARFLRQWEKREEALFQAISKTPSEKDIVEALGYFQVARNFAGLSKGQSTAGKIRKTLLDVRADASLTKPVAKVSTLAASLQADFGQFNLSAATKLLWLTYRDPIVVYDNRAVTALTRRAKHRALAKNYSKYLTAWRFEYEKSVAAIEVAIANLPSGRAFMPRTLLTDTELIALSTQEWFKERVFDIFLWEVGGDG